MKLQNLLDYGYRRSLAALLVVAVATASSAVHAAVLQTDDLSTGLAGWGSGGSAVTLIADGGPTGAGDGFLRVTSTSRLAARNTGSAWTGNFTDIGATRILADLMVPVDAPPLEIRAVLFEDSAFLQASARWSSIDAAVVPADGLWRTYEFSLAEPALALVLNSGIYDQLMADVGQVMLRHDPGTASSGGSNVLGTLGVDNVTLAPAEVPPLYGDYDDNGVVDLADYNLWRDHVGAASGTLDNDPHTSAIGDEQYSTWKSAFGSTNATGTIQQVPTPTSAALCTLATITCFFLGRTQRWRKNCLPPS